MLCTRTFTCDGRQMKERQFFFREFMWSILNTNSTLYGLSYWEGVVKQTTNNNNKYQRGTDTILYIHHVKYELCSRWKKKEIKVWKFMLSFCHILFFHLTPEYITSWTKHFYLYGKASLETSIWKTKEETGGSIGMHIRKRGCYRRRWMELVQECF